jgi:hypothetical protein
MGPFEAAVGVAGSLVALGAYVYLLGGFVLWLKLTAARLPTDDSVAVFESKRMLAVGFKALTFELLLAAALFGLAFGTWKLVVRAKPGKKAKDEADDALSELEEARTAALEAEEGVTEAKKKAAKARGRDALAKKAMEAEVKSEEAEAKAEKLEQAETEAKTAADQPKLLAWKLLLHALIAWIFAVAFFEKIDVKPWWLSLALALPVAAAWAFIALRLLEHFGGGADGAKRTKRAKCRWWTKTVLTVIAAALAAVFLAAPAGLGVWVLLVLVQTSHFLKKLPSVRDPAKLVPAVLVITVGLSLVVAAYLATTPVTMDSVLIVMNGNKRLQGGYVGKSSEGIYVATCHPKPSNPEESGPTKLRIISPDRVQGVVVGGPPYVLDYESHPSLLDVGLHLVTRDRLGELIPTVALDVREDKPVCGLNGFFAMGEPSRNEQTGLLSQRLEVFGAGSLELSGEQVESQQLEVGGASDVSLPIVLDPAARKEHLCGAPFRTPIEVAFEVGENEETERQDATVAFKSWRHPRGATRLCALRTRHRVEGTLLREATSPIAARLGVNAR